MRKAEIFGSKIYHSLETTVVFLGHETLTLYLSLLYHTPTYGKRPTLVLFFTDNIINYTLDLGLFTSLLEPRMPPPVFTTFSGSSTS